MDSYLRRIGLGVAFVALLVGVLVGHIYLSGEQAMLRSDHAFHRGEVDSALEQAREAAAWYLPHSPHVERAYARMRAIALGAETRGEAQLAQRAWSELRGVLIETAHPWPLIAPAREGLLEQANHSLVRLLRQPSESRRTKRFALSNSESERTQGLEQAYAGAALPSPRVIVSYALGLLLMLSMLLMLGSARRMPRVLLWASGGLGLMFWLLASLGA